MDAPSDIDALADALREDGVVIERAMGTGETQDAHDRIAALVRETPFPVYVALVEDLDGLPDDATAASEAMAGLLNRRLGDGLYVLQTTDSSQRVWSYGLGADPAGLSLAAYANGDLLEDTVADLAGPIDTEDYVYLPPTILAEATVRTAEGIVEVGRQEPSGERPVTLEQSDADRLAERAVELDAAASWRPRVEEFVDVRVASPGTSILVGGLSGLVVALLLGQTLVGWPRRREPAPEVAAPVVPRPPDLHAERRIARAQVDALTTALAATDWAAVHDRDTAGRALTARDAVEPLLASDDVADLVGAQVVARAGSRDLSCGTRGRGTSLRTCFFDPRHPEASAEARWRLGDGEVEVPCCEACATAVRSGRSPDHLRLPSGRDSQPYWERGDVWARTGFGATTDFLARDVLADRERAR
ncbi:hypothetical protein GCM10011376_24780 [Nocardioides flavus (ex Wang et al. 2016)]|uniref:Uncharacterized protein n=1 Tax=Nocardioides flavus (ex Wang et al. 2016) TaxID=2058780 RepID=A0ABQ3HLS0_9ACTN|nr:hypothetical protein [Nocardioides flavus (ex Wang et al. 2016)]GHE17868.1 hypothetical protein GCM10011376_24780 [Nocardioides flavus (ex Wang et al. 2016)]